MRSTAGSRSVASTRRLKRYLTTGKVGEMLEVSPAAIKKWIQQGKLAAFRTPGGHFRILADEFERFQKTHGFRTGTGEPLRVLVVDEERDVTEVIVASLRAFHPRARLETAANGFEGLLRAGTLRPDVLLLDLGMPGMDGFDVSPDQARSRHRRHQGRRDDRRFLDAEPRARTWGADGFRPSRSTPPPPTGSWLASSPRAPERCVPGRPSIADAPALLGGRIR
jgi:excisionase family DNA binding protein